jgi:hypothetical protein
MTTDTTPSFRLKPVLRLILLTLAGLILCAIPSVLTAQTLTMAGLRSAGNQGQFNGVQADASGNLLLLLDQQDGIRLLKTDATATILIAQAHLGSQGDAGLALALDPSGNVYVTGTTSSGSLTGTSGAAFPTASGTAINSFVAKFDSSLSEVFLTFAGSGRMSATAIAATATGVFITGSIFTASLPVTASAILQAPSFGSIQNGFVERFNSTGSNLLYATYLTGAGGDTAPSAIAADTAGNAYITGYTSASGYPTLKALVPNIIPATAGATSGFLTKLTPTADGLVFSTFVPGAGLSSIAIDSASQTLLLSGNVSLGQFPVANVQIPLIPIEYQTVLRMPLDGSTVTASTLVAPGSQSFVSPGPSGTAWIAGALTLPLLPTQALASFGNSFAAHLTTQNLVDHTIRLGGLPSAKPTFASALVNLTSLTTDSTGQPTLVGAVTPTASASLLATQTYDLPLFHSPTAALTSTLRDAVPAPATCVEGACPGSAAYLAQYSNAANPSLALSYDAAPNLTLRNLGSVSANALTISATNFTVATNCPPTLPPGAECSIALTGAGPGTVILQASNAPAQTIALPTLTLARTPFVFSPRELDFGVQTSGSAPTTLTITLTNLTTQPQSFVSKLDTSSKTLPYTLTESASDCTLSGPSTKLLAAGASCHITLSLAASNLAKNDTLLTAQWLLGTQDILLTGYTQAAALSLSASEIAFGTQYSGGLRLPRYLYLSNTSDATVPHASVASTGPFTIADHCPSQITAHTVCQVQIDYLPATTPSSDSATLSLDQGLSALLTGQSLPQPGVTGSSANPNLSVSPTTINFANTVIVTSASGTTQTVTISNTGAAAFALKLDLSGDFTEATNCGATLSGNSSCTAVITFAPSLPGTRQGLLTVTTGANTGPTYVNLSGIGTAILPANNGTLDLGSVPVGQPVIQWYKVSQPFSSFRAAVSGSDFTVTLVEDIGLGHGNPPPSTFTAAASGTCINCWLGVQFQPSLAGTRTANLSLTSSPAGNPYPLSLTGLGLPLSGLILSPTTTDFGSVPVHSTTAPTLFTVTNLTGNSIPITLTPPTVTGDFVLSSAPTGGAPCTGSLAIAASCFIQVTFSPIATGQRSGTLTLQTSAGDVSAQLTGFATADPGLSLNPTALLFRNLPGGTATLQTITLTNTGSATLQIATPTVALASFQPTTTCSALAPGGICTVAVTFIPTTAAVASTLQIPVTATLNGSATTTTYQVPLTGAYTSADSSLQIIPSQADFGPNATSTLGLTRQFTVNNLTAKSLTLDVALPRQFVLSGPPCSGLAPNASCSFSATFLPLTNGDITGTIFARANSTDGSPTISALAFLEGFGIGTSTLAITGPLSPGSLLNFGQVSSGQSSAKTLTLINQSAEILTIRRIISLWPFLSASTCGQPLALNQSCTVTVTYSPLNQLASSITTPLPTPDAGTLTIQSDALSGPDVIDLAGSAAPVRVNVPSNSAPLLSYSASQNSLTFPTTSVGNISVPQTITLSNTGTTTLHLISFAIDPNFAVTPSCTTLVPGSSCDLSISFTPQLGGTRIGALQILSDSSSALDFISLIGAADPSILSLIPASLNFGTVLLGNSALLTQQVTNTGTTPVSFSSITATGDYVAGGTCPVTGGSLPSAASCTVQVTFTPAQTGVRTGVLSLTTSTSTLPLTANLTGIGAQSQLQIAPGALGFGNVAINSSAILSITLTNTGNAPVTAIAISASAGDFVITTPCAVTILQPGASCSTTITFAPTAVGARTGTLTVSSSDLKSPFSIPLTGNGTGSSVITGSFTLLVDGAAISSVTVVSGHPATYNLSLTPIDNFSGTVVLSCAPLTPADFASCSLLPSSLLLSAGPQTAVVTLNTISSAKLASAAGPVFRRKSTGSILLALLTPGLFFFWRRPRHASPWVTLFTGCALAVLLTASGCGGGGDPSIRFSPPGVYRYQVTASSTSGLPITQTVILNLTVQSR